MQCSDDVILSAGQHEISIAPSREDIQVVVKDVRGLGGGGPTRRVFCECAVKLFPQVALKEPFELAAF